MNGRQYRISAAEESDGPEILAILEQAGFSGAISLLYTRRPDPLLSLRREGEDVHVFVCRDTRNNSVCMFSACAVNPCFVEGQVRQTGYLFSLRLREDDPGVIRRAPEGYRTVFREMEDAGVELFITTILTENTPARKMLEKRRASMPVYEFIGEIETLTFRTGGHGHVPDGLVFRRAESTDIPRLVGFCRDEGRRYQYFPLLREEDLRRGTSCPGIGDFFVLTRSGSILAAGALWDQRDYKQYVAMRYGGLFRLFRLVSKLLFPLLGYPSLPPIGSVLNMAVLSFLLAAGDDPLIYSLFLRTMLAAGRNFDSLSFGLHVANPLLAVAKKKRCLVYRSRLYRVWKPGTEPPAFSGIPYVEIGRL